MNDERFSSNKKRYFTVDFKDVTDRGLTKIVKAFGSAGETVADVVATNKQYRQEGLPQKKAQLIFENGQSITMIFTEQGDIAITRMNGKVIPVDNMTTVAAYAKELAQKLAANQPLFNKTLARKAKAAIKDVSALKPVSRTVAAQIKEAEETLEVATSRLEVAKASAEQLSADSGWTSTKVQQTKSKLKQLRDEIEQLTNQIDTKKSELGEA